MSTYIQRQAEKRDAKTLGVVTQQIRVDPGYLIKGAGGYDAIAFTAECIGCTVRYQLCSSNTKPDISSLKRLKGKLSKTKGLIQHRHHTKEAGLSG